MNRPKHVIYRSKGCRTCRARKVKCDETYPICLKCTKSRLQCQGYTEPTTFVLENPQDYQSSPKSLPIVCQPSSQASREPSLSAESRLLPYPAEAKYVAFLVKKFCIGTPGDMKGYSWLRDGLEMTNKDHILQVSSHCLAEVYYGRHFQLQHAITNGMATYGLLLQSLREQLRGAMTRSACDLMKVILACMVMEAIVPPSTVGFNRIRSWHMHSSGLARVIFTAGPHAFRRKEDFRLFLYCKAHLTATAITTRQPTFLAGTDWKTIPWMNEEKDPFMEIWDLLCDVPDILAELERRQIGSIVWPTLDIISGIGPEDGLIFGLKSVLQSLFNWRWKWERRYRTSAKQVFVNASDTLTVDNSASSQHVAAIRHDNRFHSLEIIYYNATLNMLLRLGNKLLGDSLLHHVNRAAPADLSQPLVPTPLTLPADLHSLEDTCSEFYRSLEGHLYLRSGFANETVMLSFALALANFGVTDGSKEEILRRIIRQKIVGTSGFTLWAGGQ